MFDATLIQRIFKTIFVYADQVARTQYVCKMSSDCLYTSDCNHACPSYSRNAASTNIVCGALDERGTKLTTC